MLATSTKLLNRVIAKIYHIATNSYKDQNFLGQTWIPKIIEKVPEKNKRAVALHFLSLSPHYFIYQWSGKYGKNLSRRQVLEAENQRNVDSRISIANTVLKPFLSADKTVLDFGCGPGWLAKQMSDKVRAVKAIDISCGALACARIINSAPNIEFIWNQENQKISIISDQSVDLVVTFAVLQHVPDDTLESVIGEFYRVLRPGGTAVCHIALNDKGGRDTSDDRFSLLMKYRDKAYVERVAASAGFKSIEIHLANSLASAEDDITDQHIMVLKK